MTFDDLETDLINSNVLPGDPYDIPVVVQDKTFNADGTIFFDPLDHNGYLGDVFLANGKAQPFFRVERRKYRFRFLVGSNARFWELRLSNGQPFIGLGTDSWLYPNAIERDTLLLSPAKRADVIIDFTDAPDELFLENILVQEDGRGPKGKLDDRVVEIPGTPVIKFIVEGPPQPNSATADVGTTLRPHTPIREEEIVTTRVFEFERRKGAWQINHQFFDENLANATPTLGTAERWILRNEGGGWWHPIHIHLESHQIQRVDGQIPPLEDRFKSDTTILGSGTEAEVFMKFRTFRGPFVFHCHNLEHEDMRMMFVFDPRTEPTPSPQPIQQSFP
ncbi:MAG: multicopper oxidase domain-containing protein [Planctomycetaceae bacterium]|nr:multicopper oxidase domain-containing protein [Planctomycetaceae bacterium]